jgi:hypothetical protein
MFLALRESSRTRLQQNGNSTLSMRNCSEARSAASSSDRSLSAKGVTIANRGPSTAIEK